MEKTKIQRELLQKIINSLNEDIERCEEAIKNSCNQSELLGLQACRMTLNAHKIKLENYIRTLK